VTAVMSPERKTRRRPVGGWALTATVLTGQAMAALDTSIVNVAGPSIQHDLHLSGASLQLAIYSYVLVYAVGLIIGARLGGRHGYGRVFAYGTALFTVSSLGCALAVDPAMLVAARAAQGLGAALLVPQVLSILQTTFEGDRRRRALSLYSMILAVGVGAGQVLGGILVSADLFGTGWRPIFLVNVPVGVGVLICSAGRLPSQQPIGAGRLDLTGAGLLAVAVLALVTPLTFGAGAGWPWWCWPALLLGGVGLLVFGRHEAGLARLRREPLVDPAMLAPREVRAGLVGIFILISCFGALLFSTALYLQNTQHDSPLRSGLTFAGFSAGFATASLTWRHLPASWHARLPAAAFISMATVTAGLARATSHAGWPWQATGLLAAAGIANGAGFGSLVQHTAGRVAREHAASASGVLTTTNQLAIVAGIAAGGTLYLSAAASPMSAMSLVLLAIASVQALVGTTVSVLLAPRAHPAATAQGQA
jgi:MFS family permease